MASRKTLFEDQHIKVIYMDCSSKQLIITFSNMMHVANGERFYADVPLEKNMLSAIGFMTKDRNWFPTESMLKAIELCQPLLDGKEVIAYGGSMGGYAALKYSALLKAQRVFALDPQYSINPKDLIDSRYMQYFSPTLHSNMKICQKDLSEDATYYILYDPFHKLDSMQVKCIKPLCNNITVNFVDIPFANHNSTTILADSQFLYFLLVENYSLEDLYKRIREVKRGKGKFLQLLLEQIFRKKPTRFLYLLQRMNIEFEKIIDQNFREKIIRFYTGTDLEIVKKKLGLDTKYLNEKTTTELEKTSMTNSTQQTPFISIIIPVFNASRFIRQTLDSIIDQTLKNIEIVCVNDGSTDNSLDILQEYQAKDSRIKILTQKNQGSGIARNLALKHAKGEFVAFMDSDDWYPGTDVLSTLYSKAKEYNAKLVGGYFIRYYEDGRVEDSFSGIYKAYRFDKEEIIQFCDYQFDYGYHRFIYNKSMLDENGIRFPDYLRFQDPPFFLKALIAAQYFVAVNKQVYAYRKGHQVINWDRDKLMGLLSGLLENILLSKRHRLGQLQSILVDRLEKDFYKPISTNINLPVVYYLLNRILESIDLNLLGTNTSYTSTKELKIYKLLLSNTPNLTS